MRFISLATVIFLAFTLGAAATALADFYGDITQTFGAGKLGVEGAYTDYRRKVDVEGGDTGNMDYNELSAVISRGVGESGQVRGRLGTVSVDAGDKKESGLGLGVGYRHVLRGNPDLPMGGFARLSLVNAGDISFNQIDVGFGVSHQLEQNMRVYGGGLISQLNGKVDSAGGSADFSANSEIGAFGGGIFNLNDNLGIGVEIHAIFESGFALLVEMAL